MKKMTQKRCEDSGDVYLVMRRLLTSKAVLSILVMGTLITAFVGGVALRNASTTHAAAPKTSSTRNAFCSRLGKSTGASSGALTYCFGPQGGSSSRAKTSSSTFGPNVDAANPNEDITPNGTRAYGQSETSIAGNATYAVEAWNDATGFFAPCPSPMFKEELTGLGFSNNGGQSFKDLGGLPNDCTTGFFYFGDPTVETWTSGGTTYFYIGSLYINLITGQSDLAMDACKVSGTGSSATLKCNLPTIVAAGVVPTSTKGDFLDKDFFSIDPQRGRLYMSYTRFGLFPTQPTFQGQIELAVCDIGTPSGGTGSAGGTAGMPVCFPGTSTAPYFVVHPGEACENEGAYPAVDIHSGAVYVAWEYNWATNFLGPAPCNTTAHVQNRVAFVPFSCLTLTPTSPCKTTPLTVSVNIVSIDLAFIPGYNRVPFQAGNAPPADFPRIAVSDPNGTVTIVWNDTRFHPLGDILLQSYNLVSLSKLQSKPVVINPDTGGMHFLPALRQAQASGLIDVSYYQRDTANTDITNVDALINLSPTTTSAGSTTRVTSVPSSWNNVSSDIIPNFGDYTDNYVQAVSSAPYHDDTLYVAWSDGRLGVPQPFSAHGIS